MGKTSLSQFIPKFPEKYIGPNRSMITMRSTWEISFARVLDENPGVLHWSSECISIPYRNPVSGHYSMYKPDFFVIYIDAQNNKHAEVIEIKPEKEMPGYPGKVSQNTKLVQAINAAKWQAALQYCVQRNWKFRVATEKQLFAYKRK